ncbi:hypothetical protein [Stenotrophomonas maltophilia]|uniref:hypothetical protein n=1 Tax=Stenotrophomonas maltophilia TaxID=40324 RepID=UPI0018F86DDD|nr:hypothetical protein [Stenotrophomonas maltophilia]
MKRIFAIAALVGCGSLSAAPLPLTTPYTLEEGATLPTDFAGHDMVSVYNALKSIPAKYEFETAADHATRVKSSVVALPAAIATGQLCAGSMVINPLVDSWKYNTEKRQYEGTDLYIQMHRVNGYYAPIYGKETRRRESSYMGTNAYGVTARVPKVERTTYQVALPRNALTDAAGDCRPHRPGDAFQMMSDAARNTLRHSCRYSMGVLCRIMNMELEGRGKTFCIHPGRLQWAYHRWMWRAVIASISVMAA